MRRLLPLALALCGCAGPTSTARTVADSADSLGEGQALIIFARPADGIRFDSFLIVEEDGRFLTELPVETRSHVVVEAGAHTFVGWSQKPMQSYVGANRIVVDAAPGRAYFVWVVERGLYLGFTGWLSPFLHVEDKPRCHWWGKALALRRVAAEPPLLEAERVREMVSDSAEWLTDLEADEGAAFQKLPATLGLPAMLLDPKLRGTDPAAFCDAIRAYNELSPMDPP